MAGKMRKMARKNGDSASPTICQVTQKSGFCHIYLGFKMRVTENIRLARFIKSIPIRAGPGRIDNSLRFDGSADISVGVMNHSDNKKQNKE